MTTEKNKKISIRHQSATWFLVFLMVGSFLFGKNVLAVGDYNKVDGSRLNPSEWNNLVSDFVTTWATSTMAGPLGIGTAPSAALDIFGKLQFTSGGTIYNTDSTRYLDMTGILSDSLRVSGNLYSTGGALRADGTGVSYVMGNLGVGTTVPLAKLDINGAANINSSSLPAPVLGGTVYQLSNNATIVPTTDYTSGFSWVYGQKNKITIPSSATAADLSKLYLTGFDNSIQYQASAPITQIIGIQNSVTASSSGAVNLITASSNSSANRASNVATASGITASVNNIGGGTITNAYGIKSTLYQQNGGGTITNAYGVSVGNLSNSTGTIVNTYGFHVGDITTGTQTNVPYSFYASDPSAYNYFAGNVGIGTTTPTSALVINPSGTYSIDAGSGRIGNLGTPALDSDAATVGYVKSVAAGTSTVPTVGYWTANGANIYNANTGNVGIGTTTPTNSLQVYNASASQALFNGYSVIASVASPYTGSILLGNTPSYQGILDYSNAGNTTMTIKNTYNNAASIMNFDMAATHVMTLLGSGNVGIGTTAPGAKLEIRESRNFDVATSALSVIKTGGATTNDQTTIGILSQITVPDSANSYSAAIKGDSVKIGSFGASSVGVLGLGRYNGTPAYSVAGLSLYGVSGFTQITGNTTALPVGNAYSLHSSGDIQSSLTNYYSLYLQTPTGAGAITNKYGLYQQDVNSKNYFAGSVGIGSTAPVYKLDVAGTGQFTQPVIVGTPTAANHAVTKSYFDSAIGDPVGAGTAGQTLRNDGNGWVANSTLFNNGTNVGIGTTAPAAPLHIVSATFPQAVIQSSSSSPSDVQLRFSRNNPTSYDWTIGMFAGAASVFQFKNIGGASIMSLLDSGNVGIGTVSPSAALDIFGKVKTTSGGTIYNTDSGRYLDMTGTLTDSLKVSGDLYSTAGELKTDGAGINYMLGSLGIGTNNPSVKLDIVGDVNLGNQALTAAGSLNRGYYVYKSGTTAYGIKLQYTGGEYGPMIFGPNQASRFISFGKAGTALTDDNMVEQMRLDLDTGNLGIATTNPSEAKLVINAGTGAALKAYGNGIFTGTLQTQTGSDFAEEFITSGDLEPGTVVVMDDNGHKSVKPCAKSYDKTVVGIVSNDPSIIAGRVNSEHKAVIAMMGVVKVKVSNINGNISKGDLLTTSGIYGYAMKALDTKPGTVIGKALENLNKSTGEINVLVNLQ